MIKLAWFKISPDSINLLNSKPGVYVISVLLKNGSFAAIYVGQSVKLKERMFEHFSENETNVELKKFLKNNYEFKISYAYVEENKLDGLEKYLISIFRPRYNTQVGNGDESYKCSEPNVIPWPF